MEAGPHDEYDGGESSEYDEGNGYEADGVEDGEQDVYTEGDEHDEDAEYQKDLQLWETLEYWDAVDEMEAAYYADPSNNLSLSSDESEEDEEEPQVIDPDLGMAIANLSGCVATNAEDIAEIRSEQERLNANLNEWKEEVDFKLAEILHYLKL